MFRPKEGFPTCVAGSIAIKIFPITRNCYLIFFPIFSIKFFPWVRDDPSEMMPSFKYHWIVSVATPSMATFSLLASVVTRKPLKWLLEDCVVDRNARLTEAKRLKLFGKALKAFHCMETIRNNIKS